MISVVLPVFNAERYLKSAIRSILRQTYRDFELIIIDDRSTDNSFSVAQKFKDKKIKLVRNKKNEGVAKSLNKGLHLAKGKYIARMDADDISLPQRFAKQVSFLKKNPRVGVLGTWARSIDEKGREIGEKKSLSNSQVIKKALAFGNPIIHSTVMFRRVLLERYGHYDENFNGAEDYELWLRFGEFTEFANIPEYLLHRRLTRENVSFRHMKQTEEAHIRAKIKAISTYHYSILHAVGLLKAFVSYFVPVQIKQIIYEKRFNY